MNKTALNVIGTPLVPCSFDPLTGYYRDGCCTTDHHYQGSHAICAKVTQAFLDYSLEQGSGAPFRLITTSWISGNCNMAFISRFNFRTISGGVDAGVNKPFQVRT